MADEEKPLEEGEYLVYYLDSSTTRLAPQPYRPQAKDADGIIAELMEQFQEVPADVDSQPALSDKVVFQKFTRKDQVLYLYFDANYNSMKPEREILCRAALTKMLTQVDGVDYINIYCADQPLMDRSGNPVGMLSGSDFIMNTSNVNAYEKTELTLYFADGDGGKLVQEKREVVHNINTSPGAADCGTADRRAGAGRALCHAARGFEDSESDGERQRVLYQF